MLLCFFVASHIVFHKKTVYFMTRTAYDTNRKKGIYRQLDNVARVFWGVEENTALMFQFKAFLQKIDHHRNMSIMLQLVKKLSTKKGMNIFVYYISIYYILSISFLVPSPTIFPRRPNFPFLYINIYQYMFQPTKG